MEASRGVPPKLVGACSGERSLCREKGRSTMRQKIDGNPRLRLDRGLIGSSRKERMSE
jgi:hypothetical protein